MKSSFFTNIDTMRTLEPIIKDHIDPNVREYVRVVNATILDMQAYIDYMLMDDE